MQRLVIHKTNLLLLPALMMSIMADADLFKRTCQLYVRLTFAKSNRPYLKYDKMGDAMVFYVLKLTGFALVAVLSWTRLVASCCLSCYYSEATRQANSYASWMDTMVICKPALNGVSSVGITCQLFRDSLKNLFSRICQVSPCLCLVTAISL